MRVDSKTYQFVGWVSRERESKHKNDRPFNIRYCSLPGIWQQTDWMNLHCLKRSRLYRTGNCSRPDRVLLRRLLKRSLLSWVEAAVSADAVKVWPLHDERRWIFVERIDLIELLCLLMVVELLGSSLHQSPKQNYSGQDWAGAYDSGHWALRMFVFGSHVTRVSWFRWMCWPANQRLDKVNWTNWKVASIEQRGAKKNRD